MALRDEKTVAAREINSSTSVCDTFLAAPGIDRIVIYCRAASAITLCVLGEREQEQLEKAWAAADVIAKLQLPVRELDPDLASDADELARAHSRMLDTSILPAADLPRLAQTIRRLVGMPQRCPVTLAWVRRETLDTDLQDYNLLDVALVPAIEPDMRRAFGIAHRDRRGLVAGHAYDYRVIGRFPEIDLHDRLLTFAHVPNGTVVPRTFSLGTVHVQLPESTSVELSPTIQSDTLDLVGRRGVRLVAGNPIVLAFADPVTEVSIELEPIAGHDLGYRASAGPWAGFAGPTFVGSVPARPRAALKFPDPIDRLELSGTAFFCGVRLHGITGAARDEQRIVAASVDVPAVVYAASPAPPPPLDLGVTNLQQPIVRAAPGAEAAAAPHTLGFRLTWRPALGTPLMGWPQQLGSPPPLEAAGFRVERRRVDIPSPWESIGGRLVYGQRFGQKDPPVVAPEVDLVALFEERSGGAAIDTLTLDDPLWRPGDERGADPSSEWQYRIAAVDMTGRTSSTWTTSPVAMLEKHRPPPPPAPPIDLAVTEPRGVRARLVQRDAPDLSVEDLALLGSRNSVLRLDWSWTDAERVADAYATEFRVYLRRGAFDVVSAVVGGPIAPEPTTWRLSLVLDRAVAVDELAGARLMADSLAFELVSHDAGSAGAALTARVKRRHVVPVKPALGVARVLLGTRGDETRPGSYEERSAIVQIVAGVDTYSHEWSDVVSVTADDKRRAYWVGVSSADAQWYVPDVVPPTESNGGRPGNESQIVARALTARYVGRPDLEIPPPLAMLPERVTDEPQETVRVSLPLALLVRATPSIPIGTPVQLERVAVSDITKRLAATGPTTFRIRRSDGSEVPYAPQNPADATTLAVELDTGEAARIDGHFFYDVLHRVDGLDDLWHRIGGLVPFGDAADVLAGAAERYIYRLRVADAAGRVSANAIMFDELVRVPSLRVPTKPELAAARSDDDAIRANASVRAAFDVSWVLFFVEALPVGAEPSRDMGARAQLIRIPNRRDLYPDDGVRLRTTGGDVLSPIAVDVAGAVPDGQGMITAQLVEAIGFGRTAQVWCTTMTRDGVPSAVSGPRWCSSGPAPIVVPAPSATRTASKIDVSWSAALGVHEIRVERQLSSGEWTAATMWLPDDLQHASFVAPPGAIAIRLAGRTRDGRTAVGAPLSVGP
ncbi:MAG: hypothetical protein AB7T06_16335 [Kofleriaceae bacterium]